MKNLKPTWDSIQNILPLANYASLNVLRQTKAGKTPIRVTLYSGDDKTMDAEISLCSSPYRLYGTALYLLERKLSENNIRLEWDKVEFLGNGILHDRFDPLKEDPFVEKIDGALLSPFDKTVEILKEVFRYSESNILPDQIQQKHNELYAENLSAAIIAHTATLKSDDLERLVFRKKNRKSSTSFRPTGMEF